MNGGAFKNGGGQIFPRWNSMTNWEKPKQHFLSAHEHNNCQLMNQLLNWSQLMKSIIDFI